PDQAFHMTYGLVPRFVKDRDGTPTTHWDDPEAPRHDVVKAKTVSLYRFPEHTGAWVKVRRDFLADYATLRNRALVQVYFAQRTGPLTEEIRRILGVDEGAEFHLKGRLLDLRLLPDEPDLPVLAQVWGVRLLLRPGDALISAERRQCSSLTWPGLPRPITQESARELGSLREAYVCDSVLGDYEGQPGFSIDPELGSVSYEHQWAVSHTRRVGRDHIAVDLRKLYEGCSQEVICHWHAHAVSPPPNAAGEKRSNVGTRARRIVYGLATLGDVLTELALLILGQPISAKDMVGLDRCDLDRHWWWAAPYVEPITRHIPLEIKQDNFRSRCKDLNKLVVEGLGQKSLRRMLQAIGAYSKSEEMDKWGSLKLLDRLVLLAKQAEKTGLALHESGPELLARVKDETKPSPCARLFALSHLRNLDAHRSDDHDFETALTAFGLDSTSHATGWGLALDAVYDGVAEALERMTTVLAGVVRSHQGHVGIQRPADPAE
ncbi:MAG: hypothetical protein ACYC3V_19120, partial [Chloroflexota bacterium]